MALSVYRVSELIDIVGEERASALLATFCCSRNSDIEQFVRNKAIDFEKHGIAISYIVIDELEDSAVIAGFYSLALKVARIEMTCLSNSVKKRLLKFGQSFFESGDCFLPSVLIAQFGKSDIYSGLMRGSDLMDLAVSSVREIQTLVGGRFLFLECQDSPKLLAFYQKQGFATFGVRRSNADLEVSTDSTLVQLYRFVRPV